MSKYWEIKWNGKPNKRGERLSTRRFETFLRRPDLPKYFEAYGFNKTYRSLFEKVRKGHYVFCHQTDDAKFVAVCKVHRRTKNAPGGCCLVLFPIEIRDVEIGGPKAALRETDDLKAKRLCDAFGL